MTTSLVTGGSGYFGSLLVRRLVAAGHRVRVLDINDADDRPADVEMILGDIRTPDVVARAVAGCDIVFNNVAQVPLARDELLLRTVNVDGTALLLEEAARVGVGKVVHTSSSAVFGVPVSNPVLASTMPFPVEAYGHAKLAAEWVCLDAVSKGLDVTIVRPRTILGHGRLGIFGILFDWIADGADVFVLGKGDNRYQFVHADDLAEVCLLAAGSPGPAVFNAGTDRFGTMRESLESLCTHAGTGSRVRSLPATPASALMRVAAAAHLAPFAPYHWMMYSQSLWFDIDHVRDTLGWKPRWSNEEMLADSYDWFLRHRTDTRQSGRSQHRTTAKQGALRVLKAVTKVLPR
ncbi:MAG: NAD-dependent epimerase/dehydratase family protein [Actinomycetota bacterium]|nr:NAD-dependent epimerase/dehydratase family protein [Actinomycetota bacterium]